jgi:hypothetical protein
MLRLKLVILSIYHGQHVGSHVENHVFADDAHVLVPAEAIPNNAQRSLGAILELDGERRVDVNLSSEIIGEGANASGLAGRLPKG